MEGPAKYALESFGFEGKCVLITGGSTGIGRAAVKQFAQLGAKVYTCARSEEALAGTLSDLKSQGLQVDGCPADVIDEASAKALVAKATEYFEGSLDVLVNNVGVNTRKKVLEGTDDDFAFVMNTNVHSALNLCRLCYPYLKQSGSASIIFNSSVAGGPTAMKSGVVYAMSKGVMVFLASKAASYVTGQTIQVDGGYSVKGYY